MSAFDEVCRELEQVLAGTVRQSIVADAAHAGTMHAALMALRDGMRSHAWKLGDRPFDLAQAIRRFDRKTRQNGFHVLHDWDGMADKVNPDIIPVDVLHYLAEIARREASSRAALAILLDYYFIHLLALLSLRIWDEGDAGCRSRSARRAARASCRAPTAAASGSPPTPRR